MTSHRTPLPDTRTVLTFHGRPPLDPLPDPLPDTRRKEGVR
ncbi:hypothetical protein [Nonomuraea sp. NPDC049504]